MLISVIVPVYGVERYLERCIDSILNQALPHYELILVDDGSSDECGSICDNYATIDYRIVVIHKINGGLSDARNAGIEYVVHNSASEWITYIDSDDWVSREYLIYLYQAVKNHKTTIACCKHIECESEIADVTAFSPVFYYSSGEEFSVKEYKYSQTAWGKLFSREYWDDLRFPVGMIHEDAFTIYKIILPAETIAFVAEPSLYFFNSGNNESITRKEWTPKRMDLIQAFEQKIEYSNKHGFTQYYMLQLKEYMNTLCYNYLQGKKHENKIIENIIRKKMRKLLKKKEVKKIIPFVEKNQYFYEIAYPGLMKQYWRLQSIKSKLKGRKQ